MNAAVIDTLRYATRLKSVGIDAHRAEGMARALGDELAEGLLTKGDLDSALRDVREGMDEGFRKFRAELHADLAKEIGRLRSDMQMGFSIVQGGFEALEREGKTLKGKVTTLSNDSANLNSDVGTLTGDVTTFKEDMVEVKRDVAALQEDVATLKEDMAEVKGDVAALQEDVAALKEDMAEVKGDVTTLKEDMVEVKRDVAALQEDVATLKEDMVEVKRDVTTLKEDMVEVKRDVAALQEDVATLKKDMAEVKGDVAVLKEDMVEVKSDIKVLDTKIRNIYFILALVVALGLYNATVPHLLWRQAMPPAVQPPAEVVPAASVAQPAATEDDQQLLPTPP